MDSQNQFGVFCCSVAVGFVGGLLYELFAFFRFLFGCDRGKNRLLGGIFDLLFCICFAIFCVFASYILHFPAFRAYIWLGFALGMGLYLKTLRRMVAFLQKVCYNTGRKLVGKKKTL